MLSAIQDRRSIRKYKNTPISPKTIALVLRAGYQAPSSKNRQPWRFVVCAGAAKAEMLSVMSAGLERESQHPLLPGSAQYLQGAVRTREIMAQAPVVILVANALSLPLDEPLTPEQRIYELCNAQSIGACMENMSLAALRMGLGSLWICDTYFALAELNAWLGGGRQLMAAMALGYPDENPPPPPREEFLNPFVWGRWKTEGVFVR